MDSASKNKKTKKFMVQNNERSNEIKKNLSLT